MNNDVLLALVRSCKDTPDDDAPRLILADWLEEYGDAERGEFIRLQCTPQVDRTGRAVASRSMSRTRELLQRNRTRWLGRLSPCVRDECFERGLIRLDWNGKELAPDLSPEETVWIESLSYFCEAGRDTLPEPRFPVWRELVELDLVGMIPNFYLTVLPLSSQHIQYLLDIPELPLLRKLFLSCHDFTAADMAALVAAPWFGQLTQQKVREWAETAGLALCRELVRSPTVAGLNSLSIWNDDLDDESLRTLAASALLGRLRCLELGSRQGFTDDGIAALAASPALESVAVLGLSDDRITDRGVAALANSSHVVGLRQLRLNSRGITDQGAAAIAGSDYLGALEQLNLWSTAVTENGAAELGTSTRLRDLCWIDFSHPAAREDMFHRGGNEEVVKQLDDPRWNGRVRPTF